MSAAKPDEYLFVTPVWGAAYTDRYVKLCLPAQLSAGNLQAMPPDRTRYLIYTRKENARAIRRSDAYRRLKELVPTLLISLDDLPDPAVNQGNPHELQTAAYGRGIRAGHGKSTAYVFLTPDLLLSDGSCRNLIRLCETDGRRVVFVAGVRMCVDGAIGCIDRHRTARPGEVCIPPGELVRDLLQDLHPLSTAHIMGEQGVKAAQHFYWQTGADGMLVHGFHLHPLLVWPTAPNVAVRNTLDDDYVGRACPDRATWHTVTDSDDVCVVEFSDRHHKLGQIAASYMSDADITRFVAGGTLPEHREMVRTPIHFHTGPVDPANMGPVLAEAARYVDRVLARYEAFVNAVPALSALSAMPAISALPAEPTHAGKPLAARVQNAVADVISRHPVLRILLSPVRVAYRLSALPLYLVLDRLNSEVLDLRNDVIQLKRECARLAARLDLSASQRRPNTSTRKRTAA